MPLVHTTAIPIQVKNIRELTPDQPSQRGCGHNLQIHKRGQQRRRGALIGLDLQQMAQTTPQSGRNQNQPLEKAQLF